MTEADEEAEILRRIEQLEWERDWDYNHPAGQAQYWERFPERHQPNALPSPPRELVRRDNEDLLELTPDRNQRTSPPTPEPPQWLTLPPYATPPRLFPPEEEVVATQKYRSPGAPSPSPDRTVLLPPASPAFPTAAPPRQPREIHVDLHWPGYGSSSDESSDDEEERRARRVRHARIQRENRLRDERSRDLPGGDR